MPINRNLLHKKLIDEFKEWLTENGFKVEPSKSIYEAVRVAPLSKGRKPLIYYLRDRTDHLTITTSDELSVARKFIRQRHNQLALARQIGTRPAKERTENQSDD